MRGGKRRAKKERAPFLRGLPVIRGSWPRPYSSSNPSALASLRVLPEGKLVSSYFFLVFFAGFFFAGMAFLRIGLDFLARFVAVLLTGIGPPLGWDAAGKAPFLMGRSHFSRRSPAIIETCYLKRKGYGAEFRKKF